MSLEFTVLSQSDALRRLVGDFATGLGCVVGANAAANELRITSSESDDELLLELLSYVALSATRTGVESGEPLCRVTYRRGHALAQSTLDLRITDFRLGRGSAAPATPES